MSESHAQVPIQALAAVCRRHGVVELAVFGSADPAPPDAEPALNLMVELQAGVQVGFSDLMDLQDEFAEAARRFVYLVPKNNLGAEACMRAGTDLQVIYRAGINPA